MKLIKSVGSMIFFFRVCEMDYIAAISNVLQWKKGNVDTFFLRSVICAWFDVKKNV